VSIERTSFDAIVVGAGHNGLVTACYLQRAGMATLLLEARASVGGTAASERFAGATVNICNCDHLTFRTTPVVEELDLADHGLTYLDVEPAGHNMSWDAGPARTWSLHHSLDETLESIGRVVPEDVEGYRRYARIAMPVMALILEAAARPPTIANLTRAAVHRRLAGLPTLLRWSRRSAADVLRSFFASDAIRGPAAVGGPMVWGISPELAGTGLGALAPALRHVAQVGRPVGGSGRVPEALRERFETDGGSLLLSSTVDAILCDASGVRAVTTTDGREFDAPTVVSACNPHDTFVRWLRNPPPHAARLVERWQALPHDDGYESKIDAVLTAVPRLRGTDAALGTTTIVAPGLADIDRGYRLMGTGAMLERPAFLVNVPTLLDPTLAAPGRQVLSLETLFTPYGFELGWDDRAEPQRWLELFADLCEPGFLDSIVEWRAMTPDIYERDFHLPAGHATSFAGGPLAAFRNPNPELTGYETDVNGLYLTGAATFPGAGIWGASGRNCAAVVLEHRS
jgi:phytoene dehydrogenase-like protein